MIRNVSDLFKEKNKIIVIVGPTAVGKTALGIKLANEFNGEIISGDSQQVYRQLNIGTAKATTEEQAAAAHHLIDIRDLDEKFSAYDFVTEAHRAIEEIFAAGKLPIIVGGTGLYIQSLSEGYHLGGHDNHAEMQALRAELEELADDELFAKLAEQQIEIPELNRRRAIRALELAEFGQTENAQVPYDFCFIGLNAEREVLYERINHRVDLMLEAGVLDEAKMLYEEYPEVQAVRAIGYKEFFPYFEGQISLDEAVEQLKQNSRRYAKRQLTWFRNRMKVEFYDVFAEEYPELIIQKIKKFIK